MPRQDGGTSQIQVNGRVFTEQVCHPVLRSDNRAGRNVSQKLRFGWDISTPEGAITRNLARGNLDSILVVVARFPSNRSRSG